MRLFCGLILVLNWLLTLCQAQKYTYQDQRRSAYSNRVPASSSTSSSYYKRISNPTNSNFFNNNLAQGKRYSYPSSTGIYKPPANKYAILPTQRTERNYLNQNYGTVTPKRNYSNSQAATSTLNPFYSSYNTGNLKKDSYAKSISKIKNSDNAKFAGFENQEKDNDGRTINWKLKKFHRRFGGALINPCSPFGRDASSGITPPPKVQGRFLWDVNVYNVYPQNSLGVGCGGYGGLGGGLGTGLFSDSVSPPYYPPGAGIANFLGLFAPGILQNSLAVTARPQQFADYGPQSLSNNDLQSDPEVDPNYIPGPAAVPVRKPNQVFYDSAGAPPLTPAQLAGGISTTVNGIIQQLTGNVQPVYG